MVVTPRLSKPNQAVASARRPAGRRPLRCAARRLYGVDANQAQSDHAAEATRDAYLRFGQALGLSEAASKRALRSAPVADEESLPPERLEELERTVGRPKRAAPEPAPVTSADFARMLASLGGFRLVKSDVATPPKARLRDRPEGVWAERPAPSSPAAAAAGRGGGLAAGGVRSRARTAQQQQLGRSQQRRPAAPAAAAAAAQPPTAGATPAAPPQPGAVAAPAPAPGLLRLAFGPKQRRAQAVAVASAMESVVEAEDLLPGGAGPRVRLRPAEARALARRRAAPVAAPLLPVRGGP